MRFEGKVAVVTGGGSGIGRATALRLAREGDKVVVAGRNQAKLDETVATVRAAGGWAMAVPCDVAVEAEIRRLIEVTVAETGRLDVLVNNAGVPNSLAATHELSVGEFEQVLDVNLRSAFIAMQAALPVMLAGGGGSIVNIASVTAELGVQGMSAYSTSKAGLMGLTRVVAAEYAPAGIRCNCVAPGNTDTPMVAPVKEHPMFLKMVDRSALKRMATPEDVAGAVAFMASDDAAMITGQALMVDGGISGTLGL